MYVVTLFAIIAVSSAAVIPQGSKNPLLISTPSIGPEETHTVSKTDKTVLSSGPNEILSQVDETSTSKTSPSATEVIEELGRTYSSKQDDEHAMVHVNTVHDYAQGQDVNGVQDLYQKEEMNAVFAEDHAKGDKEMRGLSTSNVQEVVSDPSGYGQTFLTKEDHDIHAVEDDDSFEVTGNSKKELSYLGATPDDVTSFYTIDESENLNLGRNSQGVEHSTKQSSATGFGFNEEATEAFTLDDTQKAIQIDNDGMQASVGVDKTNGSYVSMDWDGNKEVIDIDETAHKINVKDGEIGVSLNTNNVNNFNGFKDVDGTIGGYEGNGIDHSLTITDGELTANFDVNNIDEFFGISTAGGIDSVHKVNQNGKSVMIDDGERGVAVGANEINELHGVFENGEVQERYQGNQLDTIVAVAEGSSGGSLQTSEMNGVYQVKDADGKMQTVATGGQMVGQTLVIGDDGIDELLWLNSMEAPDVDGYQTPNPLGLDSIYGLSPPKPDYQTPGADVFVIQEVVKIGQDDNPFVSGGTSGAYGGPEASGLGGFQDLINQFDQLYEVGDLGRLGNIFGGGKKSKINVEITINMEI